MPTGVKQAVIAIWITIGVAAGAALVERLLGIISPSLFVWDIVVYALMCIFPYKLSKGSNPARWVYAIFFVASILLMIGGAADMPKADWVVTIMMVPVELFAIYRLFQRDASLWFQQA